jgi:hypothetical protein
VPLGHGVGSHFPHNKVGTPTPPQADYLNKLAYTTPFIKQIYQSDCLWNAISNFDHIGGSILHLQQLIGLTHILEERIQLEAQQYFISHFQFHCDIDGSLSNVIAKTLSFYAQEELTTR